MFRRIFRRRQLYTASGDPSSKSVEDNDQEVSQWKLTVDKDEKYRRFICDGIGDLRATKVLTRRNSQNRIFTVREEERNAAIAWERLRQLCSFYEDIVREEGEKACRDQGLRTLLHSAVDRGVILRDIDILEKYPDGFTPEMFSNLGHTLNRESFLYDVIARDNELTQFNVKCQNGDTTKRMRANSV